MRHLKSYNAFAIVESAGYGRQPFVSKKIDKSYYYYFKAGTGKDETGIVLKIGKFSRGSIISEAEKSYAVLHIAKLSHDELDDILVNDREYIGKDEQIFNLSMNTLDQVYNIVIKALDDYLEKNPKVIKFYDELRENLDIDHDEYTNIIKNKLNIWAENIWSVQDGATDKILIYSK